MAGERYPWYETVSDGSVEQGDIFENCPVFRIPPEAVGRTVAREVDVEWEPYDLIVMSQSCDLVAGREKVADVLLCSVWNRDEVLRDGRKASHLEQIRKGQLPRYQLLAECTLDGAKRDLRVVDFGDVRSLPLSLLRRRAVIAGGKRLRLMPPYREHLSQGFARFFMRVGLPVDIAPIK